MVPRLVGKSVVGSKWIYKVKQTKISRRGKFRARWAEGVHAAIPPGGAICRINPKNKFGQDPLRWCVSWIKLGYEEPTL